MPPIDQPRIGGRGVGGGVKMFVAIYGWVDMH
jgi:hypothetical protein